MSFKLENNVPEVYVDASRDFQLLCRTIDIYLCGCIGNASLIPYQLDLDKCSEALLPAIARMQGFVTDMYIPPQVLRNICKVFPYCIKNKGTEDAIRAATLAVLSSDRLIYEVTLQITRSEDGLILTVQSNAQSGYLPYLRELFRFIVPAGWKINILLARQRSVGVQTQHIQESKELTVSGITSKVMGNTLPLTWSYDASVDISTGSTAGMYSRIGYIPILRARSNKSLKGESHLNASTGSLLINDTSGATQFYPQHANIEAPTGSNSTGGTEGNG